MNPKPRPNRKLYIEILRRMTPQQRLLKSFELTQMSRDLLRAGLRSRFPDATDEQIHRMYLERLAKCHNRNY